MASYCAERAAHRVGTALEVHVEEGAVLVVGALGPTHRMDDATGGAVARFSNW